MCNRWHRDLKDGTKFLYCYHIKDTKDRSIKVGCSCTWSCPRTSSVSSLQDFTTWDWESWNSNMAMWTPPLCWLCSNYQESCPEGYEKMPHVSNKNQRFYWVQRNILDMLCGIYKTINIHTPFLIYPVLVAMSFMSLEALSTVDMLNAQLGYQLRHSVLGCTGCLSWNISALFVLIAQIETWAQCLYRMAHLRLIHWSKQRGESVSRWIG